MTQASYEQVVELPTAEASVAAPDRVRFRWWQSLLIAMGSLALIYGLALGVMVAGGALMHTLYPKKHLDIFAALHNVWVASVLLGITVLWLLPPHPWAKRVVAAKPRQDAARPPGEDPPPAAGADVVQSTGGEVPGEEVAGAQVAGTEVAGEHVALPAHDLVQAAHESVAKRVEEADR